MNRPRPHVVVRPASAEDVAQLPGIERSAGTLFDGWLGETGLTADLLASVNSIDTFERARRDGHLWVAATAEDRVVGFALVTRLADFAHLEELDVLPSHARQGFGSALVDAVCSWAGEIGCTAVTLRTFRDVPWNRAFYERKGFQVVPSSALSAAHTELEAAERLRGLRTDLRVLMIRRPAAAEASMP